MEDIQVVVTTDVILRLRFLDAVHPSLVPLKADHWFNIFRLFKADKLFFAGLFTSRFHVFEEKKVLILEEYEPSILQKDGIKTDEDVVLHLRIFDFATNRTARFSKVSGGSFSIKAFDNAILIYYKNYFDKTVEFEINLDKLPQEAFTALALD